MLKHGLRDLTLDDAGEFLEDLGVDLGVSGLGLGLLEVLFRVLLELVNGVILGDVEDEVVVELRKLFLLDVVEFDLEGGVLASQVLNIVVRELDVDVKLLTGLVADDLILEAGDELAGSQGELVALALAAFECLAVDEALEVDGGEVVVLGLTVHLDKASRALEHGVDLTLNVLVGDLDDRLLSGEALVVVQLNVRLYGDFEAEFYAVLVHFLDVDVVGVVDDLNAGLFHSVGDDLREELLKSVIVEDALAVIFLDHSAGGFALAEAGDADVLLLAVEDLGDSVVELVAVHSNFKLIEVGVDVFCFL